MENNQTFVTHYFDFTLEEAKALKNSFDTPSEKEKIILVQVSFNINSDSLRN